MDPSIILCASHDSLREISPTITYPITINSYQQSQQTILNVRHAFAAPTADITVEFIDAGRYETLQRAKDAFANDNFLTARDATNPFEKIGRSIFMNRAAVKLANIDAVLNVSPDIFIFDRKSSNRSFTFCDVAAGPGGFTQYLQYRYPNSIGYGMTLKSETLDWNTNLINMQRFTPFYGPDNTGNLYNNWQAFIDFVLKQQPLGVDLVTADGGFDVEEGGDRRLLSRQEFLSSRLLVTQSLIGVGCTRVGGNFVLKVFDTVTRLSAHVLFILAQCFEEIVMFKPASSRPANAERYLICRRRRPTVQTYYDLLALAARAYTNTQYLTDLFAEPLPNAFTTWLYNGNKDNMERQLLSAQQILLYMQGRNPPVDRYNITKFLTIWNLPDTPPNKRHDTLIV
jgi:cap1 methyltransferase